MVYYLFAGYTPYYTCVIWGGYDDNSKQTSSNTAYTKNVYREVMKRIHEGLDYKDFTRPSGITSASICSKSGLKPTEACSQAQDGSAVYTEYFAVGTLPNTTCSTHITLNICELTGMVANANCPAETVVQKVFVYGGDSSSSDSAYVATDEFINTICTHIPEVPEIIEPVIPPEGEGTDTPINDNQEGTNEQPNTNSETVTPPSNNNTSETVTPPSDSNTSDNKPTHSNGGLFHNPTENSDNTPQ